MSTTFFTDLLKLVAWVFTHYTPIFFVFCMACLCSVVQIIKYIIGLKR